MTKKKCSFGRTIFILILLLILIAGGYFGYKYYLEQNTSTSSNLQQNIDFQIAGTWYVSDVEEGFGDSAFNFIEYTFEAPTETDGKLTGVINVVKNDIGNLTRTGSYEVIGENKLLISFPNEMDYEFIYTHNPDEQKLEMSFVGQNRTLTRSKPVVEESTPQTEEEKIQTKLWMDNIADVDWKNEDGFTTIRFNKPVQEDGIIKGKMQEKDGNNVWFYKYERISDGEVKCKQIQSMDDEYTGTDYDFSLKMELLDDGNTLVLYHSDGRVFRYTH